LQIPSHVPIMNSPFLKHVKNKQNTMKKGFIICCVFINLQNGIYSQSVGIGTAAPLERLHVFAGNMTVENGISSFPLLSFRNSNVLKGYIGVNNNDLRMGTWPGINTTGHIALVTNSVDRMRIMPNGDVGIGVLNPLSRLHIANDAGPTQFILGVNNTSGGYTSLYMGTSVLSNGYSYLQSVKFAGSSFGDLIFNPNAGNVGVRTTAPRGIFDIGGGNESIYLSTNTTSGNQRVIYMPGNIVLSPWNGTEVSYLDARREITGLAANTSLQIRTSVSGNITSALWISPLGQLVVNGSEHPAPATLEINQANQRGVLLRNVNGNYWETTSVTNGNLEYEFNNTLVAFVNPFNGSWNSLSDMRLKKDITPVSPVLKKVLALKPAYYRYKHEKGLNRSIGFIAQEAGEHFPELVNETKDKNGEETMALNYSGFAVIAIKAIQEQQKIIEDLQNQVNELKEFVKKLAR
jgi:trimeric autotransporter adhesin